MNAKDIKDLTEMKTVVAEMEDKIDDTSSDIKDIKHCLMGDPKDRKDLGLVGDVRNNVRWRDKVNKTLATLGLGVMGLFVKEAWQHFVRRGG